MKTPPHNVSEQNTAAPWPNDGLLIDNADSFHELIDQLSIIREAFDLTLEEVGRRMGTDKSAVSKLESGSTNPTVRTLNRYASAIGAYIAPVAVAHQELPEWQAFIRSVTDHLEYSPLVSAPAAIHHNASSQKMKISTWRNPRNREELNSSEAVSR